MNFNLLPALKAFFKTLFAKIVAEGEAAVKLAENDAKVALAKSKIAVFAEANKIKTAAVTELEKLATDEHVIADKVKADLDALIAKL